MAEKEHYIQLSVNDLRQEVAKLKREYFDLRMNLGTAQVKDYSQFRKLRVQIARALTFIKQKEQTHGAGEFKKRQTVEG